jgi:hypothetical protein
MQYTYQVTADDQGVFCHPFSPRRDASRRLPGATTRNEEDPMSSTGRYRDTEIRAPRGTHLNVRSWLRAKP